MIHEIPLTRRPETILAPIGRCIYCRRVRPEVELTREHIIPDGIWGDLTLPEASCIDCAKRIMWFETAVIRNNFGDARDALGIRSRKPRGKNKAAAPSVWTSYGYDGSPRDPKLHVFDTSAPISISSESCGVPPSALSGGEVPSSETYSIHVSGHLKGLPKGRVYTSKKIDSGTYSRFVAKIAHCYAAAMLGIDAFTPWLCDYILERDSSLSPHLVGIEYLLKRQAEGVLHWIDLNIIEVDTTRLPGLPKSKKELVVVRIDLFSPYQLPVSQVVVGELRRAVIADAR